MTSYLPDFSTWSSLYSGKTLKIYLGIYLIIIFISYFGRSILPNFWNEAISNNRVKGKFCNSLLNDKSNLDKWSGCKSCDKGCSCKNCPLSFRRFLFRRVLIPVYIYGIFFIMKLLGMVPILSVFRLISNLFIGTAKTWFPIILALVCIIPLFTLPLKTQYIFIGNDKVGFKELDNGSGDGPYICGNSSSLDSNVVGLAKAKNYFGTGCSVNAGKLVLYSLIPLFIVFLIFCLIVFISSQKKQNKQVIESSISDFKQSKKSQQSDR